MVAPTDVTGLALWFKASDLSGHADGTAIGAAGSTDWVSAIGTSSALQGTAGNRPTKQTVSGKTVVRFDNTDDVLSLNGDALSVSANRAGLTYFVKANLAGVGNGVLFYCSVNGNSGNSRAGFKVNSVALQTVSRRLDGDSAGVTTQGGVTSGVVAVFAAIWDYANGDVFHYIDNSQVGTNASATSNGSTSATNSDLVTISEGGDALQMDLYEILVYTKALDSTERATIASYFAGGITQAVGLATETDTAQATTRTKSKTLGLPSSTNTAQPVTRTKTKTLGLVTSANTALQVSRLKSKAIGQPALTNTAQPVTRSKIRTLGEPSSTNTAQPVARSKIKTLGLVTSTNTAQSISRKKTKTLGEPTSSNTALAITANQAGGHVIAVGQTTETDTAQSISRKKTKTLGISVETDTALGITRRHTRTLGLPTQSSTVFSITKRKLKPLGRPVEVDQAMHILIGGLNIPNVLDGTLALQLNRSGLNVAHGSSTGLDLERNLVTLNVGE